MTEPKLTLGAGRKFVTEQPPAPVQPSPKAITELPKKPEANMAPVTIQSFTLAGTTHSGYDFTSLEVDQPLRLVSDPLGAIVKPEVGHPDPYAISVQDLNNKHIGYLKSEVAKVIFKALASEKFTYEADVSLLKGGHDGLNWGVDVLVKFYTLFRKDT